MVQYFTRWEFSDVSITRGRKSSEILVQTLPVPIPPKFNLLSWALGEVLTCHAHCEDVSLSRYHAETGREALPKQSVATIKTHQVYRSDGQLIWWRLIWSTTLVPVIIRYMTHLWNRVLFFSTSVTSDRLSGLRKMIIYSYSMESWSVARAWRRYFSQAWKVDPT